MDKYLKNTTTAASATKNPVTKLATSAGKVDPFATDPKTTATVFDPQKSKQLAKKQEELARQQKEAALKAEMQRKKEVSMSDPVAKKLVDKVGIDMPKKQAAAVEDEKLKKKVTGIAGVEAPKK